MKKCFLLSALLMWASILMAQVDWQVVPTRGMGFVDGLIVHPQTNTKYVRTDVGGLFKWDDPVTGWANLTDDLVTLENRDITSVEAFALDLSTAGAGQVIYALSGNGGRSFLSKSSDNGSTWVINQGWYSDSIRAFGNGDWRCAGERLAVDPNNNQVVYCGTRFNGLWKTTDAATEWNKDATFPLIGGNGGLPVNGGVSFVVFDPSATTLVGGQTVSRNIYLGLIDGGVHRSADGGITWCFLESGFDTAAYNPVRAVFENGRLIVALMEDGDQYSDGEIWSFVPNAGNCTGTWSNKTPGLQNGYACPIFGKYMYNAVAVRPGYPNTVYAAARGTTPRKIFFTENFDATVPDWNMLTFEGAGGYQDCLSDYQPSTFSFLPSWVAAEGYDWVGNIAFDQDDDRTLWLTTGNGVMIAEDVTADTVRISCSNTMEGMEILCVNQVASPPAPSTTPLITASMDNLGSVYSDPVGGVFTRIDEPFGLGSGSSLAYSFGQPDVLAIVGQYFGDPIGYHRTLRSTDGGSSWQNFWIPEPDCADASWGGNIAIAASDGDNMVWVPNSKSVLDACADTVSNAPKYTVDGGATWSTCSEIDFAEGSFPFLLNASFAMGRFLESDKVEPNTFYYYAMPGYSFLTQLWRTTNGGAAWQLMSSGAMPITGSGQLKANPFVAGDLWFAPFNTYILENDPNPSLRELWHSTDGGVTWSTLTTMDEVYAFGFGMKALGSTDAALIVYGKRNGTSSLFVSDDGGLTFADLGTNALPEGIISDVEGDMKVNGRVYVTTGCRGVWYGDPTPLVTSVQGNMPTPTGTLVLRPNPSHDRFSILPVPGVVLGAGRIELLDALGRVVYQTEWRGPDDVLDVSALTHGVYNVRLLCASGTRVAKLVVE